MRRGSQRRRESLQREPRHDHVILVSFPHWLESVLITSSDNSNNMVTGQPDPNSQYLPPESQACFLLKSIRQYVEMIAD